MSKPKKMKKAKMELDSLDESMPLWSVYRKVTETFGLSEQKSLKVDPLLVWLPLRTLAWYFCVGHLSVLSNEVNTVTLPY